MNRFSLVPINDANQGFGQIIAVNNIYSVTQLKPASFKNIIFITIYTRLVNSFINILNMNY